MDRNASIEKGLRRQVGQRLLALRQTAGLTQEALAAAAEMSSKHLGEIERGNENASIDYLGRLAAALGVEPYEILLPTKRTIRREEIDRKATARAMAGLSDAESNLVGGVVQGLLELRNMSRSRRDRP